MEIKSDGELFWIGLTRDELATLNNCLNEALEIVDPQEFHTRVGAERSEVRSMLRMIGNAYDRPEG